MDRGRKGDALKFPTKNTKAVYFKAANNVNLKDGTLKWEWKRGGFEKGAVTYADGALFCYGENSGDLVVLEATPSGPKQIGSLKLPERTKLLRKSGKAWAHPVIANGNLYLRDQDLLYCFDLKAK